MWEEFTRFGMDDMRTDRRRLVRVAAVTLAAGGASAMAGCGDPGNGDGEGDGEDEDGGGAYREDEFDPRSDQDAGTSAGGSSAG